MISKQKQSKQKADWYAYIGRVKSKTTQFIFAAHPLSTQHYRVWARRVGLGGYLLSLKISPTYYIHLVRNSRGACNLRKKSFIKWGGWVI